MQFFKSIKSHTKQKIHNLGTGKDVIKSSSKTAFTAIKFMYQTQKDSKLSEFEQMENLQMRTDKLTKEHLRPFILTMWNVTVVDIETTLRKSCHRILADLSVTKDTRRNRINGLDIIGEIYMNNGASTNDGIDELKKHIDLMMGNIDINDM